jgi:hypothetical protein
MIGRLLVLICLYLSCANVIGLYSQHNNRKKTNPDHNKANAKLNLVQAPVVVATDNPYPCKDKLQIQKQMQTQTQTQIQMQMQMQTQTQTKTKTNTTMVPYNSHPTPKFADQVGGINPFVKDYNFCVNYCGCSCGFLNITHRETLINNGGVAAAGDLYPTVVIFLHMRKSSGTSFLNMIGRYVESWKKKEWLYIPPFVRNEYRCWNKQVLDLIPDRSVRKFPMVLFTNFRDPIERIGSQANYATGWAAAYLLERTRDICGEISHCACIKNRRICNLQNIPQCQECQKKAKAEVDNAYRTDSTRWFDWFKTKQTFSDAYMQNYYLKRITGIPSTLESKKDAWLKQSHEQIKTCMSNLEGGCDFDVMNNKDRVSLTGVVAWGTACPMMRAAKLNGNDRETLELAKSLISDKIDFYIMENIHDNCTVYYMANLLGIPDKEMLKLLLVHQRDNTFSSINATEKHKDSFSYRSRMPADVVKFLEEDNKLDIELYNYAKWLFNKRKIEGQWKC